MARKGGKNKAGKRKASNASGKAKNKMKTKSKNPGVPPAVRNYMKLVNNPCNGPLVRAIGSDNGGSIIERARTIYSFPKTAGNNSGYMAWFPGFTNGATGEYSPGCCYYFENTDAAVQPFNTVANPMGTTANTSGVFLPDPASQLIGATSPFARAKATAACMQMYSSSQISLVQGQIACVARMSLAAFDQNSGASGAILQPPSVDRLLAYAAKRVRYGLDGHELKWGPSERESQLRTAGTESGGSALASHTEPDACFWRGAAGTRETRIATPDPNNVYGIIFIWTGIYGANTNQNHITFTKVSELELAPRSGAIEPAPRARTEILSTPGFENVNEVVDLIDRISPEWRTSSMGTTISQVAATIGAVYTGAVATGMMGGRQRIGNQMEV